MPVRVYKFGGASLADTEKLKSVASFLKKEKELHGDSILAVVSAMGQTTDELIRLAKSVSRSPNRRELDMLLTVGERTSMSLMSLALQDLGLQAISFTGSQAGILTDTAHGNAHILEIRPFRIQQHLEKGNTVVLAGFQGVSEETKEITTLGRGGTDTTAVAMASYFRSSVCEFKKDVGGLFSVDPKVLPNAQHLPRLTFKNIVDMTFWGGKFLHYRAAELAATLKLPLRFSHFQDEKEFTVVSGDDSMLEQQKILSINSHKDVHLWSFTDKSVAQALLWIQDHVAKRTLPHPQILSCSTIGKGCQVLFVGELGEMAQELKHSGDAQKFATVTATCHGAVHSDLIPRALASLAPNDVHDILQDTTNVTFVVPQTRREDVIKKLHALI